MSTPAIYLPGLQTPTTASSHVARSMALMTAKFAVSLAMVIALGIEKGHAFSDETGKRVLCISLQLLLPAEYKPQGRIVAKGGKKRRPWVE